MQYIEKCELLLPRTFRSIVHLHLSVLVDMSKDLARSDDSWTQNSIPEGPSQLRQLINACMGKCLRHQIFATVEPEDPSYSLQEFCPRLNRLEAMMNYLSENDRTKTKALFSTPINQRRDLALRKFTQGHTSKGKLQHIEDHFNVHEVANALRSTLALVAPFLIPKGHHSVYGLIARLDSLKITSECNDLERKQRKFMDEKKLKALRLILMLSDKRSRLFLRCLFDFLKQVQSADAARPTDTTLSALFASALFSKSGQLAPAKPELCEAVRLLLAFHPTVFDPPDSLIEPMKRAIEAIETPD